MTDNKRRTPSDAKSPHCLWQGELKRILKCEHLWNILYELRLSIFKAAFYDTPSNKIFRDSAENFIVACTFNHLKNGCHSTLNVPVGKDSFCDHF
jgi:hypothetical protein